MKLFKPNDKYTKIAIYSLITILCCIVFVILCINSTKIFSAILTFLSAIKSIFYGIIIALVIYPLIRSYERMLKTFFFKKKDHPRIIQGVSIAGAYLTVVLVVFVLVFSIAPTMSHELSNFTAEMSPKFSFYKDRFMAWKNENEYVEVVYDKISDFLNVSNIISIINPTIILNLVMTVLGEFYNILIGLIISIYLIISRREFGSIFGKIFMAFFSKKSTRRITMFLNRLYINLTEYLSIRVMSSLYIACMCYALCWIFRIPFYPLIALFIFFGNLIPVFGPVIVTIVLSVIMLLYKMWLAPLLLGIIIFVQVFDTLFIERTMLSKRLRPNIGVTIVIVIISFMMFSIMGILLCIPVYATLYTEFQSRVNKIISKREKTKDTLSST